LELECNRENDMKDNPALSKEYAAKRLLGLDTFSEDEMDYIQNGLDEAITYAFMKAAYTLLDRGSWMHGKKEDPGWDAMAVCDERILPNLVTPSGSPIIPGAKTTTVLYGGTLCIRKGLLTNCMQYAAPLDKVRALMTVKSDGIMARVEDSFTSSDWVKNEESGANNEEYVSARNYVIDTLAPKTTYADMLTWNPGAQNYNLDIQMLQSVKILRAHVGNMAINYDSSAGAQQQGDRDKNGDVRSLLKTYDPRGQAWFFAKFLESKIMAVGLSDTPCASTDDAFG